jgi:predicted negative regulator of RcsB-dependent stress response
MSKNHIGNVLLAQGDSPGALSAYQEGLEIVEALVQRDPTNTQWQCDLAASKERIGDALVAQGDDPGALSAYQAGLDVLSQQVVQ